ncbi:MAG TPA: 2-enoyl thioester reductase domain-containing protein [Caulobacteraceae bacterium]|nr:2-enoyl thioester reductase domain-containing protein [Caulobacteraceae bacterium]
MKAVQLVAYGDAVEGVEVREIAEPDAPGAGEVLVATKYAPINFNDLMVVWGVYPWKPEPPETLGNEGMGTVVSVGAGVTAVKPGDRVVLPLFSRTWRERQLARAEDLIVLPPEADAQQAAMVAINGATAAMLLDSFVDLQPGDAVAYNAATSGLGRWVAALARRRGLKTIGLVRRAEDVETVRASSGCEIVIPDGEEIGGYAQQLAGASVRLALDGVGGASVDRLLKLLTERGTIVVYGAASGKPMEVSAGTLIFKRVKVEGFYEGHPDRAVRVGPILHDLVRLLGPDGVKQPIAAVYPVPQAKEAVAHAVKGGKVLLSFGA